MNARNNITKSDAQAPTKGRISAVVRKAIDLRFRKGVSWEEAARLAGCTERNLHAARAKPHVKAHENKVEAEYIASIERLSKAHKARALEVARDLLDNSASDAVKARMVEFLRGESKAGVHVNVQNNVNIGAAGYEFVPPGAKVIDIEHPANQPDQDGEDPENEA